MSLHHIAARLRYASKTWQTFLDQKYEGGSKKVRNPNQETKDHFPEVSVYTALRDEQFHAKLTQEYEQWKDSDHSPQNNWLKKPSDGLTDSQKDQVDKAYKASISGSNMVQSDIMDNIKNYIRVCSEPNPYANADMKKRVTNHIDLLNECMRTHLNMSKKEKFLLTDLYKLHDEFIRHLSDEEYEEHHDMWRSWLHSSDGEPAMAIHNHLSEMKVTGDIYNGRKHFTPMSEVAKTVMGKAYAYQQDVFKHLGITHITLYRGLYDEKLDTDPPSHGDKVKIKTRPASSWSIDPVIGSAFKSRVVKCQVPVEKILASPMVYRKFGDSAGTEFEFVVMGAEELDCEIFMGVH